ncbi:MAG: protein kinase domain-containing protein [Kiritimatiellia bacterium]
MPDIFFFCPRCKQRLEAPTDMAGERIECPGCQSRIRIPSAMSRVAPAVSIGTVKTMGAATPSSTPDLVGRVFGKDRVTAKIGEGGMGSVWLTEHAELKVPRALKTMPEGFSTQQDLVQRFRQEAEVLAKLTHPNIAQIHDFGNQDGVFYFIMEYLPGGNLRAKLHPRGTRLPWREALRITDEICAGMAYAHGKGIVHRDIKPENILFDEQGNARLADFGLGKILGDVVRTQSGSLIMGKQGTAMAVGIPSRIPGSSPQASLGQQPTMQPTPAHMTMQGQIVGTMDYMSPEQRRGAEVTPQSDIYSLGVTLFEMLTGESQVGMDAPSERAPDCPPAVDVLVKRMMASPDRRFPTAGSVREELARVMAQPGGPAVERPRPTRKLVAGIAIAAAALIVGVLALLPHKPDARETERIHRAEYANLVGIAQRAETEQQWTAAKDGYADALKSVEGVRLFDSSDARIGLARAESELANRSTTEQKQLRSAALVNEAKLAESKRQWKEAITAYEEAGKLFDNPEARAGAARTRSALGKESDGLVEKGKLAESNGQWGEAVKAYEAALALKDDPAITAAVNKANLSLAKERDDLAAKARQGDETRKRAEFERLMADGAKAQASGDFPAAKSAYERADAAAPTDADHAQVQAASKSVVALAKKAFTDLEQKARNNEERGNPQGAIDILTNALAAAPDEPSAARVRTYIAKLKYDIAHPPATVNQTVTLSWAADAAAVKRFPAVVQILDSAGQVFGEMNLTRGQPAGSFGHATVSTTLNFKDNEDTENKKESKICEFRRDDPIGQTRVGRAKGLLVSGRITEMKKGGVDSDSGSILTITIQVTVRSSGVAASAPPVVAAPADVASAPVPDDDKKTRDDPAYQEKKAAWDDLMQLGKDAEDRKDWQGAKDIYIKALAAAPDAAAAAQVRARGSQVVAQIKNQPQPEQSAKQPQQGQQVNQTVRLGLTSSRILAPAAAASAKIVGGAGNVIGIVSVTPNDPAWIGAVTLNFSGKAKAGVCSFTPDDPAGQIKSGQAEGLNFSAQVLKIQTGKDDVHGGFINTITLLITATR